MNTPSTLTPEDVASVEAQWHPSDTQILDAMEKYGGSFVKSLSNTMRLADPINFERLRAAFDDRWKQYTSMARHVRK
jgi:hypothetical protein